MSRADVDFLREFQAAWRRRPPLAVGAVVVASLGLAVVGVGSAHFAVFDVVTHADGRVMPVGQTQVVQNPDGGILRELLVGEGDTVKQGQVLARLDGGGFQADPDGTHIRRLALAATSARLEAEALGGDLRIPPDVEAQAHDAAARERALFKARQAELESAVQMLGRQLAQREGELGSLESHERTLDRGLVLQQQELALAQDPDSHGPKARPEPLKLERQVSDAQASLDLIRRKLPTAHAAVEEARRRVEERREAFQSAALGELNKVHAEIISLDATLASQGDHGPRRDLRAPLDGVVKRVAVGLGSVVTPGSEVMEIAPLADAVLVEGHVKPALAAPLHAGQKASVRLGGEDSSQRGLPAVLEQVSSEPLPDSDGEPYVLVRVRAAIGPAAEAVLGVQPGMPAAVDISTGQRTVLDLLLTQLRRSRRR